MLPQCIHTISSSLGNWALATSTANSDTVNNIALLGLVTKTASFVGTRWTGCAVDDVQLSELYFALSAKFNECIAGSSMKMSTSNVPQYSLLCMSRRPDSKYWVRGRFKGRSILPPSIGHGEGIAGHRIASSSAAPRHCEEFDVSICSK